MIPEFEVDLEASVPSGYVPWVPRPDEIDEEGFGFFIGTWALGRIPRRQAREVVDAETKIASLVDVLADDDDTYEELAGAVESANAADVPDIVRHGPAWEELETYFGDSWLGGLELGVAGLVTALATIGGCYPAASCRAHTSRHSWSPYPVVLLAADEFRTRRLEIYVGAAGCGFVIDAGRPQFLGIGATSVRPMMVLANELLNHAEAFRRPRAAQRNARPPSGELRTVRPRLRAVSHRRQRPGGQGA